MISERSRSKAGTAEAESRVDYLSDMLGIEIRKVINVVEKMRMSGILAKDNDMYAYLRTSQVRKLVFTENWRNASLAPCPTMNINSVSRN